LFGGSTRTIPARTHNAPTLATPPPNSARTAPRSAAAALRTEPVEHPKTAPVQRLYRLYSTHTVSAQNPSQHLYCTSDLEALFPKLRDLALGCGICMGKRRRDLVWCAKLQNPKIEKLHLDFLSLLTAVHPSLPEALPYLSVSLPPMKWVHRGKVKFSDISGLGRTPTTVT